VNIFATSPAMRKVTYLALSSHTEINLFLRSVRFLKYAIDALLLHLFVLTRLVHSNIVSYLVAEMLARNAAPRLQRFLVNNIRRLLRTVTTYARRYYLKSLVNPAILRIKITGKLAGSLRTRNYFIGPRHLPLHTIAHSIEVSSAMVNTKYGIFTVRVWCW
jgi:ribosomal protein S3